LISATPNALSKPATTLMASVGRSIIFRKLR